MRNLVLTLALLAAAPVPSIAAQAPELVGHAARLERNRAVLNLEMSDGTERRVIFARGEVMVGDVVVGTYAQGGVLERIWRELIGRSDLTTPQLVAGLRSIPIAS